MSESESQRPVGVPLVAVLLTWFLPGAGHLYLGRVAWAAAVFLVVEGLFLLGLLFSAGMTFEYLDVELRSSLAPVLSPEIGNLGGYLWQMHHFGFGPGHPRPWPDTIRLGSVLAGLAGVLNAFAMVHAHLACRLGGRAQRTGRSPVLLAVAGWLIPGLGHLLQGRRVRALMIFVLLVGLFAWGTWLADGSNLSRERHFYYWSGQFMLGLPAAIAELAGGALRVQHEIRYADAGLVFGCVAGLLNILAVLDVYGREEDRLLRPRAEEAPVEPAGGESEAGA